VAVVTTEEGGSTLRIAAPPLGQAGTHAATATIGAQSLYIGAGALLGVVFVKSEVLSWYRIQEMFRFQSAYMYLVIASALAVAAVSVQLLRWIGPRTQDGQAITVAPKEITPHGARYWLGGTLFGLGWSLLGACPGPIFALIGAGVTSMSVALLSALAGTWLYGALQSRLPH
jgi:uncharacterized membrane protein YedE/YeeE